MVLKFVEFLKLTGFNWDAVKSGKSGKKWKILSKRNFFYFTFFEFFSFYYDRASREESENVYISFMACKMTEWQWMEKEVTFFRQNVQKCYIIGKMEKSGQLLFGIISLYTWLYKVTM